MAASYLVSAEDYESMAETDYLLRSPVNAARLLAAAEEVRQGPIPHLQVHG